MFTLAQFNEAHTDLSWTVLGHTKLDTALLNHGSSWDWPRVRGATRTMMLITSISPMILYMYIPGNIERFLQWGGFIPVLYDCFFLLGDNLQIFTTIWNFFTPGCRNVHWEGNTVSSWLSLEVSDFYLICNVLRARMSNIKVGSLESENTRFFFLWKLPLVIFEWNIMDTFLGMWIITFWNKCGELWWSVGLNYETISDIKIFLIHFRIIRVHGETARGMLVISPVGNGPVWQGWLPSCKLMKSEKNTCYKIIFIF